MPPTTITRQPGLTKFLTDLVEDLRGLDTKSASPTEMLCIADNGISAVSLVASLMARRKLSAEAVAGYHLVGKVCALGTSAIAEVAGSDTLNSHFDPWFSTVDPDAYRTVGGGTLQIFHSELCVVLSEQVFESGPCAVRGIAVRQRCRHRPFAHQLGHPS